MKMGIWKNSVTKIFLSEKKWIHDLNSMFQITKLVASSACVALVVKNLSSDKRNKEL